MELEVCSNQDALDCPTEAIRQVVRLALEGADAALSIALVDDAQMTALNQRFLGRAETTDVLAFPYEQPPEGIGGEIVVNAELALRESAGRPHSAEDELMLYVVHGLLHLLGYDDADEAAAGRMREREITVLRAAGRTVER